MRVMVLSSLSLQTVRRHEPNHLRYVLVMVLSSFYNEFSCLHAQKYPNPVSGDLDIDVVLGVYDHRRSTDHNMNICRGEIPLPCIAGI